MSAEKARKSKLCSPAERERRRSMMDGAPRSLSVSSSITFMGNKENTGPVAGRWRQTWRKF